MREREYHLIMEFPLRTSSMAMPLDCLSKLWSEKTASKASSHKFTSSNISSLNILLAESSWMGKENENCIWNWWIGRVFLQSRILDDQLRLPIFGMFVAWVEFPQSHGERNQLKINGNYTQTRRVKTQIMYTPFPSPRCGYGIYGFIKSNLPNLSNSTSVPSISTITTRLPPLTLSVVPASTKSSVLCFIIARGGFTKILI